MSSPDPFYLCFWQPSHSKRIAVDTIGGCNLNPQMGCERPMNCEMSPTSSFLTGSFQFSTSWTKTCVLCMGW